MFRNMFLLDEGASGGSPAEGEPASGKLSQEDVNRLVGNARSEGRSAAAKDLLKQLGFESVDDLSAVVKAAKEAEDQRKSEAEKLQAKLAEAEAKAAKVQADAEAREAALKSRILNEAIKAQAAKPVMDKDGKTVTRPAFKPEALDDVLVLIDRSVIEEGEAGEYKGIEKALAELAKGKAYLLAEEAKAPAKGTPSGGAPKHGLKPQTETPAAQSVIRF